MNVLELLSDIKIDNNSLFIELCKSLNMEYVLDVDNIYIVRNGLVYIWKDGSYKPYDERVNLFVALRNVAVNLCPNVEYRSDSYIFNYEKE